MNALAILTMYWTVTWTGSPLTPVYSHPSTREGCMTMIDQLVHEVPDQVLGRHSGEDGMCIIAFPGARYR